MISKFRKFIGLLCFFSLFPALPLTAGAAWQGLSPNQMVIIQGSLSKGRSKVWSTYQGGAYHQENRSGESFRTSRTLVIREARLTFSGDTRKVINLELGFYKNRVPSFPLARLTFMNSEGVPFFTATNLFTPGLVVPAGGQVQVVDKDETSSGEYEVMLYGYYAY